MEIPVGARQSSLSRAQVREVEEELRIFYPELRFLVHYVETRGDKDKTTSLRDLGKSDFFTHELDLLQKEGVIRMAIHSAKDLPDPMADHLIVGAMTVGLDPSDCIVVRKEGVLPKGARIATSSYAREKRIKEMRSDLICVDIRGTIEERLAQLEKGQIEGVVMAEAALIRLRLTYLPRIPLPGPTTPGQGQLACVIHKDDDELHNFLSVLRR